MTVHKAKKLIENLITSGNSEDAKIVRDLLSDLRTVSGALMVSSHTASCPLGPRDPDALCNCGVSHAKQLFADLDRPLDPEPIDEAISLVFGQDRRVNLDEFMARNKERLEKLREAGGKDESTQIDRDLSSVTRFEVIDQTGRAYTKTGIGVCVSMQDSDRTMKIFVDKR